MQSINVVALANINVTLRMLVANNYMLWNNDITLVT